MQKSTIIPAVSLAAAAALLIKYRKPAASLIIGNQPKYAPAAFTLNPSSPLYGKHIVFLGSSITYGAAALGQSFVDDLVASDGIIADKLAVTGTTLAGHEHSSYISRFARFQPQTQPDAFVCQLSTNDGRAGKPLGAITAAGVSDFDTTTTIGAIEAIITRVNQEWHCPIMFYTCLRKPDAEYQQLITKLYQLQAKYDFAILDLRHDQALASATSAHAFAMFDDAHPTQLGYAKLWTPIFRARLSALLR
ncbi:SGNH/GDSL hydrolase family protein [Lacticaseibacillus baoqingensis]|uniref:SGNH/GDSL hydrolase family protein n=1 Tax=Lacticaseibacillus baoqingensis TaxID=2486013 RepID=A0ABW4E8X6_9LACO|nr:SGNH/GDSL hydrolase family protein [Lacticaseibacillus baoqingensis]